MSDNDKKMLQETTENRSVDSDTLVNASEGREDAIEVTESKGLTKEVESEVVKDVVKTESVEAVEEKTEKEAEITDKTIEKKKEASSREEQKKTTQSAVNAVEKHIAHTSENFDEALEVPEEDYRALDMEGLVQAIEKLIKNYPVQKINEQIDTLKILFDKKFRILLKKAKKTFLEEGGNPIDFHYDNPLKKEYNNLLSGYKEKRQQYFKERHRRYQENLVQKQAIIEQLKDLIEHGEADSIYKHFQKIQEDWRATGPVLHAHYKDIWRTYHFHVERFYDLLHLSRDFRELDFKHNLEEKMKLIKRAEELAEEPDIKLAFDELQTLHRIWKEEIGPVAHKHRNELWEQFSLATKKIHDKRHDYFDSLRETYKENLTKKRAVIEEIKSYDTSDNKTHQDWQKSLADIGELRRQFFEIGKVPRFRNREIWEEFRTVTRQFNQKKNAYYRGLKKLQQENLEKKMQLLSEAEALKETEDWEKATPLMKKIQAEWKKTGHVPRKHSNELWDRFQEACNHYFSRLYARNESADEEKIASYKEKKAYLKKLKEEAKKENFAPDIKDIKAYIKEWHDMGVVLQSQRYINTKFNRFLDEIIKNASSLDKSKGTILRYHQMIDSFVEQKDTRKIENEIQFVRKKLEFIGKEKQQLENNIQFFSNTDDSNPTFQKIAKKLKKQEDELALWEAKIRHLRSLDL